MWSATGFSCSSKFPNPGLRGAGPNPSSIWRKHLGTLTQPQRNPIQIVPLLSQEPEHAELWGFAAEREVNYPKGSGRVFGPRLVVKHGVGPLSGCGPQIKCSGVDHRKSTSSGGFAIVHCGPTRLWFRKHVRAGILTDRLLGTTVCGNQVWVFVRLKQEPQ